MRVELDGIIQLPDGINLLRIASQQSECIQRKKRTSEEADFG